MDMGSTAAVSAPRRGPLYTVGFAAALSLVAATAVSSAYVTLRGRQQANELLARQTSVLLAAGLMSDDDAPTPETIERHFESIRQVVVDLRTGEEVSGEIDPTTFDQRAASLDPRTSHEVPGNLAGLPRLPHYALVYKLVGADGGLRAVILPVEGKGLWSTLYGFLALEADLATVRGLIFYEHGETPGLGGEVDNPRWKALWPGRRAYDERGEPALEVIRGRAGTPVQDPYRIDGLSGATLTSRGVSNLVRFWLGADGFRSYLDRLGTAQSTRAGVSAEPRSRGSGG